LSRRSLRIALVSSVGGHLAELLELQPALDGHRVFWVVNDDSPVLPAGAEVHRISHGERDWRVVWNVVEVARIFLRRQPDLMISLGAGPAVSAAVVARALGIEVIYIEPSSAVTAPTLTGRLMRHLTRRLYVQWPSLEKRLRGSRFAGGLL
jgi:UDP-N-acetylglucosamine:LPS N-acetylglucosamine transferase